jgi:hypothetical protein
MNKRIVNNCKKIIEAYKTGKLGQTRMPEDSSPLFNDNNLDTESKLVYFSLPMSLNYQRDSYKLWESALKTWNDKETRDVFDVFAVSKMSDKNLRKKLLKYKLALQPNKHINSWKVISNTILREWGDFSGFIESSEGDFLSLKNLVTIKHKKGFPYLSGPKIFNYWSFILGAYAGVKMKNREFIEIAPDTHITQCSVKLGLINTEESIKLSKDQISERWRRALFGSNILPIEMHPPLWFWSKNGFKYKID